MFGFVLCSSVSGQFWQVRCNLQGTSFNYTRPANKGFTLSLHKVVTNAAVKDTPIFPIMFTIPRKEMNTPKINRMILSICFILKSSSLLRFLLRKRTGYGAAPRAMRHRGKYRRDFMQKKQSCTTEIYFSARNDLFSLFISYRRAGACCCRER